MFFIRLLSKLPWSIIYKISDFLFFLAYRLFSYRKKVVLENLKHAFPEKTAADREAIAKAFYANLADVIVETIKTLNLTEKELQQRAVVLNPEVMGQHSSAGRSVIILTQHQCNWEWMSIAFTQYFDELQLAVYQKLKSKFSEHLMHQIRSKFGTVMVERKTLMRKLAQHRKEVKLIGLMSDQRPRQSQPTYWTTFLNMPTGFVTGAGKLAESLDCAVVFAEMRRVKRGYYEISLKPLANPPHAKDMAEKLLEKFAREAEMAITRQPANWLWSHKRWKHQPPAATTA